MLKNAPTSEMGFIARFVWLASGRIVAAALQAVNLIYVARLAGPSDFGVLSAFMGIIIVGQAIFDLGLSSYVTRLRAVTPDANEVSWTLKIYMVLGGIMSTALLPVAIIMCVNAGSEWWGLVPLAIAGALERQADIRLALAVADGEIWKNSTQTVARRVITSVLLFVFVINHAGIIHAFGIASLVAAAIGFLWSRMLVPVNRSKEKLRFKTVRHILKISRAFWANSLGSQIRNLDVLLVAALANPIVAGYYSAIAKSTNPLLMFSSSLSAILLPIVARLEKGQFREVFKPILVVLAPMAFLYSGMAIFADQIVGIVFGPDYSSATLGFRLVLLSLAFAALSSVLIAILQAWESELIVGRITMFCAVIGLFGIGCGAAFMGATGAACGLAVSYVTQCLLLIAASLRLYRRFRR